jgi:DNA-binding transcriptional ArsR family regulator
MVEDLDHVWRALAEPTRRALLDLLRDGPRTTGQLVECFPALTRFAVMKHLNVLEDAGLLIVKRSGRERWNYLNAVPIRQIYERWMGPYAEQWSCSLLRLKEHVERDQPRHASDTDQRSGIEPLLPLLRRKGA